MITGKPVLKTVLTPLGIMQQHRGHRSMSATSIKDLGVPKLVTLVKQG